MGLLFMCVGTMINPHDKSPDESNSSEFPQTLWYYGTLSKVWICLPPFSPLVNVRLSSKGLQQSHSSTVKCRIYEPDL